MSGHETGGGDLHVVEKARAAAKEVTKASYQAISIFIFGLLFALIGRGAQTEPEGEGHGGHH